MLYRAKLEYRKICALKQRSYLNKDKIRGIQSTYKVGKRSAKVKIGHCEAFENYCVAPLDYGSVQFYLFIHGLFSLQPRMYASKYNFGLERCFQPTR